MQSIIIALALALAPDLYDIEAMSQSAEGWPTCRHEDGNPDGQPCAWIDPDTGIAYFVTSENYR